MSCVFLVGLFILQLEFSNVQDDRGLPVALAVRVHVRGGVGLHR